MAKKSPVPSWFDVNLYKDTSKLDLKGWYGHLEKRYFVKLLLDEMTGRDNRPVIHKPDYLWLFCFRRRGGEGEKYSPQERRSAAKSFFKCFEDCPVSSELALPDWLDLCELYEENRKKYGPYRLWPGLTTTDTVKSHTLFKAFLDFLWLQEQESRAAKGTLLAGYRLLNTEYNSPEYRQAVATLNWPYEVARQKYGSISPSEFHVIVDLHATDNQILNDFKEWLSATRQTFNIPEPRKRAPNGGEKARDSIYLFVEEDTREWDKFGILPYLDLTIWQELTGSRIKRHELAKALFPDEYDVDLTGRLDKVVRPKADWLMQPEMLEAFRKQVHSEILLEFLDSKS